MTARAKVQLLTKVGLDQDFAVGPIRGGADVRSPSRIMELRPEPQLRILWLTSWLRFGLLYVVSAFLQPGN
jgi:hypothetical protein